MRIRENGVSRCDGLACNEEALWMSNSEPICSECASKETTSVAKYFRS